MSGTRTCPECEGTGEFAMIQRYGWQEVDLGDVPCALCCGTGEISSAQLQRHREEERRREDRLKNLIESKDRGDKKLK